MLPKTFIAILDVVFQLSPSTFVVFYLFKHLKMDGTVGRLKPEKQADMHLKYLSANKKIRTWIVVLLTTAFTVQILQCIASEFKKDSKLHSQKQNPDSHCKQWPGFTLKFVEPIKHKVCVKHSHTTQCKSTLMSLVY